MSEQREIRMNEIYWSNQPFVKSHIQKGSRPYLVISEENNKGYVSVLPITSKIKKISNRYDIMVKGKHNQVICDQPQTVPISTLGRYLDRIGDADADGCFRVMLMCFGGHGFVSYDDEEIKYWERMYFESLYSNIDD